jgi:arylformamidase
VLIKRVSKVEDGSPCNVSLITMGSHTGTHIDPPYHFEKYGTRADEIPLEVLIGPALVVDTSREVIEGSFLRGLDLTGVERVLFKTRNSGYLRDGAFSDEFVRLTPDAAEYLVWLGVKLVGVDYITVEAADDQGQPVHKAFLKAGVVILEGLDLSGVTPGAYELICLPLKVKDGDGAPARVVLRETPGGGLR